MADDARDCSRRTFLGQAALWGAAATLARVAANLHNHPGVLISQLAPIPAHAAEPDPIHHTLNAVVAFVVPGPDSYSVRQGVSTVEPGGIDAAITDALIRTLDWLVPSPAPPLSASINAVLNGVAAAMFGVAFADLLFDQKAAVFTYMEADPMLRPVTGALLAFTASLTYSEAGVLDVQTRGLTGWPVGWTISGFEGIVRGHDEFRGYFQHRRRADGTLGG